MPAAVLAPRSTDSPCPAFTSLPTRTCPNSRPISPAFIAACESGYAALILVKMDWTRRSFNCKRGSSAPPNARHARDENQSHRVQEDRHGRGSRVPVLQVFEQQLRRDQSQCAIGNPYQFSPLPTGATEGKREGDGASDQSADDGHLRCAGSHADCCQPYQHG